jgi:hypothetical protein
VAGEGGEGLKGLEGALVDGTGVGVLGRLEQIGMYPQ